MKITLPKTPNPPADWWTLLPMRCCNCKTVVQLESDDKPQHGAERRPNGACWVEICCPTCVQPIRQYKAAIESVAKDWAEHKAGIETISESHAWCSKRLEKLEAAATAVLERWDSPLWKETPPTAAIMAELRQALSSENARSVAPPKQDFNEAPR